MKRKVFLLAVSALSIITLTACSTTTSSSGESDFFSEASQVNEDVKDSVKEFAPSESTSSSSSSSKSTVVYSDSYIEVSQNGGTLSFKNLTDQDLKLSGEAILNNTIEINYWSFGYIGDIKAKGITTELISTVSLVGQGVDGDKEDGETFAGDKLYKHYMKSGETIIWSGTITDSDYNDVASISFSFEY